MNTFEKEYYEAPTFWDDGAITDEANLSRIKSTIDMIPEKVSTIADIGCGNGVLINKIIEDRKSLYLLGIDRSVEALKHVKSEKKVGDILNIPVDSDSFDCVLCLQVLEHIPVNVYELALSELARISQKYIIISVPYKEKTERNSTTCPQCKSRFNVDLHLRSYYDYDVENLFKNHGFRMVKNENVVKVKEYLFINWIIKINNIFHKFFATNSKLEFRSPICPLCGYKNGNFKLEIKSNPSHETVDNSYSKAPIKLLKKFVKAISPKVERDGYWIIALYEKI